MSWPKVPWIICLGSVWPVLGVTNFMGSTFYDEQTPARIAMRPAAKEGMPVIKIGASGPWDCCSRFSGPASQMRNAWDLFLEYINNVRGGLLINGVPHAVELTLVHDFSNISKTVGNLKMLMAEGFQIFLGPFGTPASMAAAKAINRSYPNAFVQLPIASAAALYSCNPCPHVFGTLGSDNHYFSPAIDMVLEKARQAGITPRAAILQEESRVSSAWARGARAALKAKGFEVLKDTVVDYRAKAESLAPIVEEWKTNFSAMAQAEDWRNNPLLRPMVIGATYGPYVCTDFLESAFKKGLRDLVGGWFFTLCVGLDYFNERMGPATNYVNSVSFWSSEVMVSDHFVKADAAAFASTFRQRYAGQEATYIEAAGWASIASLCWAIESANSADPEAVAQQFKRLQTGEKLPTIFGEMHYDFMGHNQMQAVVGQLMGNQKVQTLVTEKNIVFPYPVCADDEQVNFSTHRCEPASCPLGQEWLASQQQCVPCRRGSMRGVDDKTCVLCLPGTFMDSEGQQACQQCQAGTFAPERGSRGCVPCGAGQYTSELGAHNCDQCLKGSYNTKDGATQCIACPGDLTTPYPGSNSSTSCGCEEGSYEVLQNNRKPFCQLCPRGVKCERFGGMPLVQEGYFMFPTASRSATKLDVYRCMPSIAKVCPGQSEHATEPVCGKDMVGLNCGLCKDGSTRSGQECVSCNRHAWIFPLFIIGIFLLCGLFHGLWNRRAAHVEAGEMILASVTLGMTLGFIQQLGIFDRLRFSWPDAFQDILDVIGIFLFDLDILAPACTLPQGLASSYLTSLSVPIFLSGIFFGWLLLSRCLHAMTNGKFPRFHLPEILNSLGMVIQAVFISIAASTVSLLECYDSPNGVQTIRRYPYVVCGDDEYVAMIPFCIFGFVFYIVGIMGLLSYVTVIAPRRFVSPSFRKSVRFLVFKYCPNRWWFGIVLLLRSLAFAMITVIEPQDGYIQFFLMLTTLMVSLFLHLVFLPYSDQFANNLETAELGLMLGILGIGAWFITDKNPEIEDELSAIILALFCSCAIMLLAVFVYASAMAQFPERANAMHSGRVKEVMPSLRAMCNLVASSNEEVVIDIMNKATYLDRAHVYEMVAFMLLELEGVQTTSLSLMRLPHVTSSSRIVSKEELKQTLRRHSSSSLTGETSREELAAENPADVEALRMAGKHALKEQAREEITL